MKKKHQIFRQYLALCLLTLIGLTAFGQTKVNFPTIGKPMPDFILKDLNHHTKAKISSADLKGKWYILDFWIRGCAPCIASFPKVSKMVQEFKGKVEIIEVGIGGKELKQFYEEIRKKQSLNMPMAYDTKLATDWQINSYPHIFIVDNKGVLRVITYELNSDKLNALINSGKDDFAKKTNYKEYLANDVSKPFFMGNNGGKDSTFLHRSVLAKASGDYGPNGDANFNSNGPDVPPGQGEMMWATTANLKKGIFQISWASLLTLYNTAYFGQNMLWYKDSLYKEAVLYPSVSENHSIIYPVLELKDSSDFEYNYKTLQGLYTYSLIMPKEKATRETMMRSMRLDLSKYFGYDAKIEIRKMPVWRLMISDKALAAQLRTKGGDRKTSVWEVSKTHIINGTLTGLIGNLFGNHQEEPAFLDETGIDYNIDILLECSFGADLNTIKVELKKNGLDLIKGEKEMKVLVIREPKESI